MPGVGPPLHSSLTSPTPKLLATTLAFRLSGLQLERQDLVLICCFLPCSKCPFNPDVLLLSMETLHPPVNQIFPFPGDLVSCCSLSNLNKFFLHVFVVWQKTSEASSKHEQSASSTAVKGRFANSCTKIRLKLSSERQMNKKCNRHCCWK